MLLASGFPNPSQINPSMLYSLAFTAVGASVHPYWIFPYRRAGYTYSLPVAHLKSLADSTTRDLIPGTRIQASFMCLDINPSSTEQISRVQHQQQQQHTDSSCGISTPFAHTLRVPAYHTPRTLLALPQERANTAGHPKGLPKAPQGPPLRKSKHKKLSLV